VFKGKGNQMNYEVTIKNENGTINTFGGYAGTQADALANIALFHGGGNIIKIEWVA
jgi:hypothetical protein